MTDWSVGDLAVCVDDGRIVCEHGSTHRGAMCPPAGSVHRVRAVLPTQPAGMIVSGNGCACACLMFAGHTGLATRFRKIRPDEHEACEPEFVTLLKRVKRAVTA